MIGRPTCRTGEHFHAMRCPVATCDYVTEIWARIENTYSDIGDHIVERHPEMVRHPESVNG